MTTTTMASAEEHRDPLGARFGMWLFLFTELLLFGGLFLLYAVYRARFPDDFHYAATLLDPLMGGVNTLILLTSSLTMALAIATLQRGIRKTSAYFLVITVLLGLAFLAIKAVEWSSKISHQIYPSSETLVEHTAGENIFFGLYYGMTGFHALHVIVGLGILVVMFIGLVRRKERKQGSVSQVDQEGDDQKHATRLESAGLFWHLVDIIWVFLFPLFYLIS